MRALPGGHAHTLSFRFSPRFKGRNTGISDTKETMKILVVVTAALLLCTQAFAGNPETATVNVTVLHAPEGQLSLPVDYQVITEGNILKISVTATDLNKTDILQYRYLINNKEVQAWTLNSSIDYSLKAGDTGLQKIKAQIKDNTATIEATEVQIFVFRASPTLPE